MTIQKTLSIIKPDAVRKNCIGEITKRFENSGLKVIAARMEKLKKDQAEKFYEIHRDKSFFNELVKFMCSGPVMIQVLEGINAVLKNRELMGATDPRQALPGTIRADFAESVGQNAVHGSDSIETANQEIAFFFTQDQCFGEGSK
jgi:nucleoside-diphosphate kinase